MDPFFVARALGFGGLIMPWAYQSRAQRASGVLGAFAGVWLNHQLRGELVMALFSLLMIAAAVSMVRRRTADASTASFEERCEALGCARLVLVGTGVGFLTGFFGVGGKLAGRLPERTLRAAFAVLVVGLAIYTFGRSTMTLVAA